MGTFSRCYLCYLASNDIGRKDDCFPHTVCRLLFMTKRFASPPPVPIQIYFVWSCNKNEIAVWTKKKASCTPSPPKFSLALQQIHYWETGNKSLPQEAAVGIPAVPTAFFLLFPTTDKLDAFGFEVSSKDSNSPLSPSVENREISFSTVYCWMPKMDLWNLNQ